MSGLTAISPFAVQNNLGETGWIYKNILDIAENYRSDTIIIGIILLFLLKVAYQTVYYFIQSRFCFGIQASILEKLTKMYLHRYPLEFYSSDTNEYIRNSVQETEQF